MKGLSGGAALGSTLDPGCGQRALRMEANVLFEITD